VERRQIPSAPLQALERRRRLIVFDEVVADSGLL
jgi:hypothetical protein